MRMSTTRTYDSYSSIDASMEDFESRALSPELLNINSNPRLKFHSPVASVYSDLSEDVHQGWSPPPWRKHGTGWYAHQSGLKSPPRSREVTPLLEEHEQEDDNEAELRRAARIALPESPLKGRSEEPSLSPAVRTTQTKTDYMTPPNSQETANANEEDTRWNNSDNYIRFSVRADVQHRTEPIEAMVGYFRKTYKSLTKSRYSTFVSLMTALFAITLARALFREPAQQPQPDLVKVAGLARNLEPLMYYSENGHHQVVQLGETGVAVWDLGESVRSTNMTSGPIIVRELDELSESLKQLAEELTRFFASVDGDIDGILLVMEWAQRELTKLSSQAPSSHLSLAFSNLHSLLSRVGLLENIATGEPTPVGKVITELFGRTRAQTTRATLHRTFHEFLGVLEESINTELTLSSSLYAHFEAIDRQFLNLQRTVIRETDAQEREESELLATLWARVIGANASRLKKFEKNKQLLSSLRGRTVENKVTLVDHNGRLMQLKSNLEILRKKLVSPLVRANDSSTLTVEEQIVGLEGTYLSLRAGREAQKSRLMGMIHEAGNRRVTLGKGDAGHGYALEGR